MNYAEQNGIRLISVELKCQQLEDKFRDACAILDYAYENFFKKNIDDGNIIDDGKKKSGYA